MESQFSDRLNSNYAPTDEELIIIKGLLSEPNQKFHEITSEIEGVKEQLEKLLKEREDINEHLKTHKALLSPVRRLTPDILQRIFTHCLPTGRNPVMSSKEAPLLLGRICSQWRDIALATPNLWAAIHIAVPFDPPPPHMGGGLPVPPYPAPHTTYHTLRSEGISAWLARSDPYPLSISVYNPHNDNLGGGISWDLYMDTIVSFASRWKYIRLSTSHQAWSSFWPRVREADVPLLENIYLDCAVGYPSRPGSPDLGYGRECGLLKALNLRFISLVQFDPHVLRLPLRWNRLVELNLASTLNSWSAVKGLSITESLAILSLCPNLEYFSVQISLAGFSPLPNGEHGLPKVKLNKLQGLSVTESGNTVDTSPFFQHITAPSLRRIKFRRTATTRYNVGTDQTVTRKDIHLPLAMLIRQSKEAIEEFETDTTNMSEMDVMKCLSLMPGLKRLALWMETPPSSGWTPPHATSAIPWGSAFVFGDWILRRFIPSQYLTDVDASTPDRTIPHVPQLSPPHSPFYSPSFTPSRSPSPIPSHSPSPPPSPSIGGNSSPVGNGNNDGEPAGENAPVMSLLQPTSLLAIQAPLHSVSADEHSIDGLDNHFASPYTPPPLPHFSHAAVGKGKARAVDEDPDPKPLELSDVSALDVLCPLLEVFECSGALFSDAMTLAFLRSRSSLAESTLQRNPSEPTSPPRTQPSSPKLPLPGPSASSSAAQSSTTTSTHVDPQLKDCEPKLAHLRKCRISFAMSRFQRPETLEQLNSIRQETAMTLDVIYPLPTDNAPVRRFSPYDGVPSIPSMGGPLSTYIGNGDWITSHGNALSGEPVFSYNAAFF